MEGSGKAGGSRSSSSGGGNGRSGAPSMFPFGSPINTSRRSILSPGGPGLGPSAAPDPNATATSGTPHVLRGRVRAQDVYGGPLAFGGTPTARARRSLLDNNAAGRSFNADYSLMGASQLPANGSMSEPLGAGGGGGSGVGLGGTPHPATPSGGGRKNRLMFSASPYHSAASARLMSRHARPPPSYAAPPPRSNTPSPSSIGSAGSSSVMTSSAGADSLSSTARLIYDTLEKMSTPLRDAQKMLPFQQHETTQQTPSRAEKRKLIAEQLNLSSDATSASSAAKRARRRPHLGGGGGGGAAGMNAGTLLKGPPTRSTAFMSPLPARTKPRGAPPRAEPKPDHVTVPSASPKSPVTPPPPPPPKHTEQQPKSLFSGIHHQTSGGGKLKSVTAKSSLRAPAPKVTQAFVMSDSQPTAAMPNITFGAMAPNKPAVAMATASASTASAAATDGLDAGSGSCGATFIFSSPKKVKSRIAAADSGNRISGNPDWFQFSAPQRVQAAGKPSKAGSSGSPLRNAASRNADCAVLPDLMNSNPPPVSPVSPVPPTVSSSHKIPPVMKMPSASVAPKPAALKAGSVMDVLGGNRGKLPDVTSTGQSSIFGGIKPASELKTGSVMSILGTPSNEPTWDPKFKTSQRPWQ